VKALRAKKSAGTVERKTSALGEAARDGLMCSLLNPKLAIFFIALFSHLYQQI
jgi:threonine/homoserine/homoserine lactone efflux protein